MIRRAIAQLVALTFCGAAAHAGDTNSHSAAAAGPVTRDLGGTVVRARDPVPLDSTVWQELRATMLGDAPAVYSDSKVRLVMPRTVEDAFNVPVVVKLSDRIGPVAQIVVMAENNPIQTAAQIFPRRSIGAIGMNIRLEQTTPVRAAALDANGVWHVATTEVEVMNPGGCSTPIGASGAGAAPVGAIAVKRFARPDRATRLKVGITHPMDTGFAPDTNGDIVPAYYVDTLTVTDTAGPIADLVTWAALSPNPSFFFDLPEARQSVRVTASDTRGRAFEALEASHETSDKPS